MRQFALQHGTRVDVRAAKWQFVPQLLFDETQQLHEFRFDDFVIVAAQRITRDNGPLRANPRMVLVVVQCYYNCTAKNGGWLEPVLHRVGPRQVAHFTVTARLQPGAVKSGVIRGTHFGDARHVETQPERFLPDFIAQFTHKRVLPRFCLRVLE